MPKPLFLRAFAALILVSSAGCGGASSDTRTCVGVCDPGSAECINESLYRVCQDANADGCTEWSQNLPCAAGTTCGAGECTNDPGMGCHECSDGARKCEAGGTRSCVDSDGDGCREWSPIQACPANTMCDEGECRPDDNCCARGQTRCEENVAWTCGEDTGGTGCGRWEMDDCGVNRRCMNGECLPTGACFDSEDCEETKLCVRGQCRDIYGVRYRVSPQSAVINPERADGGDWDGLFADTADLYLEMLIDEVEYRTETVDNSITPSWTDSFDIVLNENQMVELKLYDEDTLNFDDLVGETMLMSFPPEAVRAGGYVWQMQMPEVLTVNITIERIDN